MIACGSTRRMEPPNTGRAESIQGYAIISDGHQIGSYSAGRKSIIIPATLERKIDAQQILSATEI